MTPGQIKLAVYGVVLAVLLAVVGIAAHRAGANGVQVEWDRDKLARAEAQEKAVLAAVAANEKARQEDIDATRATLAAYQENLYAANEHIAAERDIADRDRLRITIPTRACAAAPAGEAPGAGRADALASVETIELPEAVERGLRDVAEGADREVASLRAQLVGLQDWVRTHGFYEVGQAP